VSDLARARAFYERLGWRGKEVEETVFFQTGALALVLWGRGRLADDADLDGHVWEIADNPGFPLGPDGALTIT